mmetsp:Transcript_2340/g.8323  ORF Transcript_2340/g.8323 Transcript_2340/m.8323 type:complete len:269 (-) Transcript_2340:62-868(-)
MAVGGRGGEGAVCLNCARLVVSRGIHGVWAAIGLLVGGLAPLPRLSRLLGALDVHRRDVLFVKRLPVDCQLVVDRVERHRQPLRRIIGGRLLELCRNVLLEGPAGGVDGGDLLLEAREECGLLVDGLLDVEPALLEAVDLLAEALPFVQLESEPLQHLGVAHFLSCSGRQAHLFVRGSECPAGADLALQMLLLAEEVLQSQVRLEVRLLQPLQVCLPLLGGEVCVAVGCLVPDQRQGSVALGALGVGRRAAGVLQARDLLEHLPQARG